MPESKLLGRLPDGRSRAAAGHELASLIALAAQGVEDRTRPVPPTWRALPFEGPFVVGDQIGVTGHDLLAAAAFTTAKAASATGSATKSATNSATGSATGSVAVWAPPGVRCDRAGMGTILGRVLGAVEELAAVV
jgi:hypothetical protein